MEVIGLTPPPVSLTDLPLIQAEQSWGSLHVDQSVEGHPLTIGGHTYRGIGTHALSHLTYALGGRFEQFSVTVGIDDEMKDFAASSLVFEVVGDGRVLWTSPTVRHGVSPIPVRMNVKGVQALELRVRGGGPGIDGDHADWAEPLLTPVKANAPPQSKRFNLDAGSIAISISSDGDVVAIRSEDHKWAPVIGKTWLVGTTPAGPATVTQLPTGIQVERKVKLDVSVQTLREYFSVELGAIRWDAAILSKGPSTTCPIASMIHWSQPSARRFWTAWNDPIGADDRIWHDPLEPQPFANRTWSYGESQSGSWTTGDLVTLPMFSIAGPGHSAVSFVQSPSDPIPEASLASSADGTVVFTRSHRRLGQGAKVKFTSYLVSHSADCRTSLKWISLRFPEFFRTHVPVAQALGGCGGYSGDESPLSNSDVARLTKSDFHTMWKLSDDYVYMGMFLAPTMDPKATWTRTPDSGSPGNYKPLITSAPKMDAYGKMLRSHGFHLLNYFNVCEYGVNLKWDPAPVFGFSNLWQDASKYLASNFPRAPLRDSEFKPKGAWQGGWQMDPGDPQYREHLLKQARLYTDRVPDSDGICIDRADYLTSHNDQADDGLSWYDGPSRSFVFSWQDLLKPLSRQVHSHGKAVFSNLMDPRLDLTRELDGLYCEFGDHSTVLNGAAFLCLNRPLLLWTTDQDPLNDDFFQRQLYLGAFPTAPYPNNNHCIQPSPQRDRWYLVYGPLFNELGGRIWDLEPKFAHLEGPGKLNVFTVNGRHVAVIAFAGTPSRVRLAVERSLGIPTGKIRVLMPGKIRSTPTSITVAGSKVNLTIPLSRGCAVVVFDR